jgi:hypothetical protein
MKDKLPREIFAKMILISFIPITLLLLYQFHIVLRIFQQRMIRKQINL